MTNPRRPITTLTAQKKHAPQALLMTGLLCLSLQTVCLSALAAEAIDKQITVADTPKIELKVQRGDVIITSWDKNEISVKGTLDELSEGFVFEQQGHSVKIEDVMPRSYQGNNTDGSQLTITLPRSLSLDASGVSANYQVTNLSGDISVALVSGNLKAEALEGKNQLHTVSGNIESNNVSGKSRLDTVSGRINDKASMGEMSYRLVSGNLVSVSQAERINIEQVSGNVNAEINSASQVEMKIISGDATLHLPQNVNHINADSVSGDITMSFSGIPDANVMINGGPGGKISNKLTDDVPVKEKYSRHASLEFSSGNGQGDIKLSTISGRLTLKQQ